MLPEAAFPVGTYVTYRRLEQVRSVMKSDFFL